MRKVTWLHAAMGSLLVTAGCAQEQQLAPTTSAVTASKETRQLLARHEVVAKFDGVAFHRCMGLTALCPDKCGHSGDMAAFTVQKYLKYEKPGQYGDEKQTVFQFMVKNNLGEMKVSPDIQKALAGLKPGDETLLAWDHDYVTRDGASGPDRPVKSLRKLTPDESKALLK